MSNSLDSSFRRKPPESQGSNLTLDTALLDSSNREKFHHAVVEPGITFSKQDELPRLPIPELQDTLNKFLQHLEAIQTSPEQRLHAQQVVLEFIKKEGGDGPKLQELLKAYEYEGIKTGSLGSYIEEFWNDSYLVPDQSVVLNLNPFFVLEDSPDPKIAKDPIRRAASLCFAAIKLASTIREETFLPDTFKGKPLCMDQYKTVFGAARVPNANGDDLEVYPQSSHVVTMCRNQLFYFQALWPEGTVAVDEDDIVDILMAIDKHSKTPNINPNTHFNNNGHSSTTTTATMESSPSSSSSIPNNQKNANHNSNNINTNGTKNNNVGVIKPYRIASLNDGQEQEQHPDTENDGNIDYSSLLAETSRTCPGILTSLGRRAWYKIRKELTALGDNDHYLTIIDSGLFVLVLDDVIPQDINEAAANMLHGTYKVDHGEELSTSTQQEDPTPIPIITETSANNTDKKKNGICSHANNNKKNNNKHRKHDNSHSNIYYPGNQLGSCCNRWYDKLQIIVCGDGTAGINFEHSAIDGHTALRIVSDIYAETVVNFAQSITKTVPAHGKIPHVIDAKVERAAAASGGRKQFGDHHFRRRLDILPKKLTLQLNDKLKQKIFHAETALGDEIVANDIQILEFKDYGKLLITSNNLSPDAYVQMSMMLAYYKLYGKMVCAYEPVLTKSYFHGRTEAMRPATVPAKNLCEAFFDPEIPRTQKISCLRRAVAVHTKYVAECSLGKGVDRHLFALKSIAKKENLPVPAFFQSEPWKMLNHTILSTSNCGNPSLRLFGFGAVVPDGYGIGYIIKDRSIHYSVSSKRRQTQRYVSTLRSVLKEMATLLNHAPRKSRSFRNMDSSSRSNRANRSNHQYNNSYGDILGTNSDLSVSEELESPMKTNGNGVGSSVAFTNGNRGKATRGRGGGGRGNFEGFRPNGKFEIPEHSDVSSEFEFPITIPPLSELQQQQQQQQQQPTTLVPGGRPKPRRKYKEEDYRILAVSSEHTIVHRNTIFGGPTNAATGLGMLSPVSDGGGLGVGVAESRENTRNLWSRRSAPAMTSPYAPIQSDVQPMKPMRYSGSFGRIAEKEILSLERLSMSGLSLDLEFALGDEDEEEEEEEEEVEEEGDDYEEEEDDDYFSIP